MNRISELFDGAAGVSRARKLLSIYVMPGYPNAGSTMEVLKSAEKAGADFVELGIPFSDPLADGPVIQHASQTAIENGVTPRSVLELVTKFRTMSQLPIILMGYVNSFMNGIGVDFPRRLKEAGVDGVIIPDLSLEESESLKLEIEKAGLSLVLLIAPTSSQERIRKISWATSDFVYCVSVTGVTGARKNLVSGEVTEFLEKVRSLSTKPFVVGFGISTPEAAREISKFSDGVVVGSALLQRISSAADGKEGESAFEFLRSLRTALDE